MKPIVRKLGGWICGYCSTIIDPRVGCDYCEDAKKWGETIRRMLQWQKRKDS